MEKQINKENNSFFRKYKKCIIALSVLIIFFFAFKLIVFMYPSTSDIAIRRAAAESLNKDPNEFGFWDYGKVTELKLSGKDIYNINMIKKFRNLKLLNLDITSVKVQIPKWMSFLVKLGIIDLSKREFYNLSPLKKLSKLETLHIKGSQIKNINSLKKLKNLQTLGLIDTQVTNLQPIRKLKKLQNLYLYNSTVSDIKPLKGLVNIESLGLDHTQVTDLEPIAQLKKLKTLTLNNTQVSDIEPITHLTNLRDINMIYCSNISDDKVEYLKSILQDTRIYH